MRKLQNALASSKGLESSFFILFVRGSEWANSLLILYVRRLQNALARVKGLESSFFCLFFPGSERANSLLILYVKRLQNALASSKGLESSFFRLFFPGSERANSLLILYVKRLQNAFARSKGLESSFFRLFFPASERANSLLILYLQRLQNAFAMGQGVEGKMSWAEFVAILCVAEKCRGRNLSQGLVSRATAHDFKHSPPTLAPSHKFLLHPAHTHTHTYFATQANYGVFSKARLESNRYLRYILVPSAKTRQAHIFANSLQTRIIRYIRK